MSGFVNNNIENSLSYIDFSDDVIEDDNDNVAKVLNDVVWESLITSFIVTS